MSEAKKEEKAPEAAGKPKISGSTILMLAFAVLDIGGLGAGSFMTYQATLGFNPPSIREPAALEQLKKSRETSDKEGQSVFYTMDTFSVNLAGDPRRVVRLQMTLEMLDESGFEEVVRLGPAARDAIVRILNRKEFPEVETIQGKLFLKDQIATTLNQFLKEGVVKDIYFSDFVVQ
jgi:flagellar FliL protein